MSTGAEYGERTVSGYSITQHWQGTDQEIPGRVGHFEVHELIRATRSGTVDEAINRFPIKKHLGPRSDHDGRRDRLSRSRKFKHMT